MTIDEATVARIAKLARIAIPPEDLPEMQGNLNQILIFVEQLQAVPTDGVEPMTSVVSVETPMRDDAVTDGGIPENVLANAPEAASGFFVVPKVVE